jgi:TonB family protein
MKNILSKLYLLLFIVLVSPNIGSSQDSIIDDLSYDVYRLHPPVSIDKDTLKDAQTIIDLNAYYKSSWVREYISVEITTTYNGKLTIAESSNDTLSEEQKDNMNMADLGSDIAVLVRYMPENNLKQNDAKELDFTFTVNPESEATYSSGQQQLKTYLKTNAIDKIPDGSFEGFDLAAVTFTIDEIGQVTNAQIFESSKDEKIDELLLATVCNMPNWDPAEYANGTTVDQEFVLTVGNMKNCMSYLLNIRRD